MPFLGTIDDGSLRSLFAVDMAAGRVPVALDVSRLVGTVRYLCVACSPS